MFDERRLTELFLPLRKVGVTFVGSSRSRTNALSSWLMDVAGNPWGTYDQEEVCIYCGQEVGKPAERNLAQKLCSRLAFSPKCRAGALHLRATELDSYGFR